MPSARRPAVIAVVCGVLLAGCFGDDRPLVELDRVVAGEVTETVAAPGRVAAKARQDVTATVPGMIVALEVADGDEVTAGDPLVRLDSDQIEQAMAQAEAADAAAGQVGAVAVRGSGADTRRAVNQAIADLEADSAAQLAEARAEAEHIADADQREAALAAVDALDSSLATTRSSIATLGEAIAVAQDNTAAGLSEALTQVLQQATAGQRAQAAAALEAAARQQGQLVLTAPIDGVVQLGDAAATTVDGLPALDGLGSLDAGDVAGALADLGAPAGDAPAGGTVRVGAPVTPGRAIVTVYDLSAAYVELDVDEIDVPDVAVGQRAAVEIDAAGDTDLEGVVEQVDVEAATTRGGGVGYGVRVRLVGDPDDADSPLASLRPGMTAAAEIATATVAADLVVDSRALVNRDGEQVVLRVTGGTAEAVAVDVVALGADRAALDGDLDVGDRLIVAGYEDVGDGDEVRTR